MAHFVPNQPHMSNTSSNPTHLFAYLILAPHNGYNPHPHTPQESYILYIHLPIKCPLFHKKVLSIGSLYKCTLKQNVKL